MNFWPLALAISRLLRLLDFAGQLLDPREAVGHRAFHDLQKAHLDRSLRALSSGCVASGPSGPQITGTAARSPEPPPRAPGSNAARAPSASALPAPSAVSHASSQAGERLRRRRE